MLIKKKLYSLYRKISHFIYKKKKKTLKNDEITIISNNCWAGTFYNLHSNKFNSPTINLFLMATDYLLFVKDLKKYLSTELVFVDFNSSKYSEYLKKLNFKKEFPIGKLDDIEIMFMHYNSEEEASLSWKRRTKRVNYDNALFKFNDQNLCSDENLLEFDNLELKHKLIFTTRKHLKLKNAIYIKDPFNMNAVDTLVEPIWKYKEFDIVNLINEIKEKKE